MRQAAFLLLWVVLCVAQTDPDLPNFIGNIESISECSLIIPMDQSQVRQRFLRDDVRIAFCCGITH
jgi:hypothetical protein